MNDDQLRDDLIRDEGRVLHAYQDSLGFWTIGIGHCIDQRRNCELPEYIVDELFDHDVTIAKRAAAWAIPDLSSHPEQVQRALVNMAFQLGARGLASFRRMIAALKIRDYRWAANEALDSRWARQTSRRADRIARLLASAAHDDNSSE